MIKKPYDIQLFSHCTIILHADISVEELETIEAINTIHKRNGDRFDIDFSPRYEGKDVVDEIIKLIEAPVPNVFREIE